MRLARLADPEKEVNPGGVAPIILVDDHST